MDRCVHRIRYPRYVWIDVRRIGLVAAYPADSVRDRTSRFPIDILEHMIPQQMILPRDSTMSHSHMPVDHLLKQIEMYKAKRQQRDIRPPWVMEFIDQVAELFEPLKDDGRVGFDCQLAEERWEVGMYLGSTEVVGGKNDGKSRHSNFEFDLKALIDLFTGVSRFGWSAFPEGIDAEDSKAHAFITVEGIVGERPIRLRLHSIPPSEAGPGFRQYPDGRRDTA